MNPDATIIADCLAHGIDRQRLEVCLSSHDNWGKMIHAFEYLTVLEVVLNAMKAAELMSKGSDYHGRTTQH